MLPTENEKVSIFIGGKRQRREFFILLRISSRHRRDALCRFNRTFILVLCSAVRSIRFFADLRLLKLTAILVLAHVVDREHGVANTFTFSFRKAVSSFPTIFVSPFVCQATPTAAMLRARNTLTPASLDRAMGLRIHNSFQDDAFDVCSKMK